MNSHLNHIKEKLDHRKSENALRELKVNENLVDFCSNDYLGFASEAEIHNLDEVVSETFGATGSRLISGNHKITEDVEVFLAAYYKAESALIFNSSLSSLIRSFWEATVASLAERLLSLPVSNITNITPPTLRPISTPTPILTKSITTPQLLFVHLQLSLKLLFHLELNSCKANLTGNTLEP